MESLVVGVIIIAAAAFTLRRLLSAGKGGCGCGCSCACSGKGKAVGSPFESGHRPTCCSGK